MNLATEHTPGPWHLEPCRESVKRGEPHSFGDICFVPRVNGVKVELCSKANAQLIAAAPELLALAERIAVTGMSFPKYERDLAIAAIAKAKGETL